MKTKDKNIVVTIEYAYMNEEDGNDKRGFIFDIYDKDINTASKAINKYIINKYYSLEEKD